jgi:hypothetical protein
MSPPSDLASSGAGGDLDTRITEQGNKVRQLKADKKDKAEIDEAVRLLLEMKVLPPFCGSTGNYEDPRSEHLLPVPKFRSNGIKINNLFLS